jgi:segregation and condensation protein A
MYELKLEQFSGPIEKLFELIEAKKMEITELNLAEVTADFLDYLKKMESIEPRVLADFVAIAAALLLIKSKALLPDLKLSNEEEKTVYDLEMRLKRYAEFKPAIVLFKKTYEQKNFSVSRPLFYNFQPVFYPAPNANVESLKNIVAAIFNELNKITMESQTIESSLIKLEEKIEEIAKKIEQGIGNFSEIIKAKSRAEIIVLFLALLHLLREQLIKVEQKNGFDDMIINKI